MIDHPDVVELVAFARGELDEDRSSALVEHCRTCSRCGDQMAAILLLREGPGRTSRRSRIFGRRSLAAAAAVVIAVALGTLAYVGGIGQSSGSAAHEAGASATGSAETEELARLATDRPPPEIVVKVHFGPPVIADSATSGSKEGLILITRGRYVDAVAVLRKHLDERPGDVAAGAFLGMALYLSGDDSRRAAGLLAEGTRHGETWIRDWSQWYLANLRVRRGELMVARGLLEDLERDLETTTLAGPVGELRSRLADGSS